MMNQLGICSYEIFFLLYYPDKNLIYLSNYKRFRVLFLSQCVFSFFYIYSIIL